jgi:zinc transport system substrate-binding protein
MMSKVQERGNLTGTGDRNHLLIARCAVAGILLLLLAAGCVEQQAQTQVDTGTTPLTIAVTILPQKQFVERVAGDHARVIVLVPPGASPHTHEPTPKQLEDISKASVYIKVGSGIGFERAWMDKLIGINPRMTIVDSSAGIRLMNGCYDDDEDSAALDTILQKPADGAGADPHIWLSPKNARSMVENIYVGIARADPEHEAEYRAGADAYQKELDNLDAEIEREISEQQIRTFMVYHPAWSYFARDYGLIQIPIETDGKDPSPAGIENLIRQAQEGNITVIFA